MRSFWRVFWVVTLDLGLFVAIFGGLSLLWTPYGTFGIRVDASGLVVATTPDAARAGVSVGDTIALPDAPLLERERWLLAVVTPSAATTFHFFHGGVRRSATLRAVPLQLSLLEKATLAIRFLTGLVFVGIGTALVLLRPSLITWAFFIYSIGLNPAVRGPFTILPVSLIPVEVSLQTVMFAAAYCAFVLFALLFPRFRLQGWRRAIAIVMLPAFIVLAGMLVFGSRLGLLLGARGDPKFLVAALYTTIVIYAVGVVAEIQAYRECSGSDRHRSRWVLAGFAIGVPLFFVLVHVENGTLGGISINHAVLNALYAGTALIPITVAYAVVKHHVIDVRFYISHALVYGSLTSALIAVFALIDWLFSKRLEATGMSTFAEIVVAVALGFWLNGAHRRVDRYIDRVFFRRRHAAERHLALTAHALPHAKSHEAIHDFLVEEAARALDLASGAMFRLDESGRFLREASINWDDTHAKQLDEDDPLVAHLQAEHVPLRLHDIWWPRQDVPSQYGRPTLALPILIRRQLRAFVLYGMHTNGSDIDPDEERSLLPLATSASAAYDHLEADALRQKVRTLSEALQKLQPSFGIE